jgi:tRNA(Ile)-lysidine synthase
MRDEVLRYIRRFELMKAGDRVLVAVSGGADSVALLRLLQELRSELGIVLAVAHFNHGLRGENSDADEAFVVGLARQWALDFFVGREAVADYAEAERMSVESAGRKLRYAWMSRVAAEQRFDSVATGHTLDDQAETVLMKFLRGAGSRGFAGIYPEMFRGDKKKVRFVRLLLGTTRAEVEAYLVSIHQPWREDESNLDHRFRRNRVRHELLPLLEREYNPNLRAILSDTGELNRAEEEYWSEVVGPILARLRAGVNTLRLCEFASLNVALQRRLLRAFLQDSRIPAYFQHIERLRDCALGETNREELPEGWSALHQGACLVLKRAETTEPLNDYEYKLPVPGEVIIREVGCVLRAIPVTAAFALEAQPGTLLNADAVGPELHVRNWQPGDRFHPAYCGSEEKLKRLFSEYKIPADARPLWPVVLKQEEIIWVKGMPVADAYCWREGDGDAVEVVCARVK